jgi:hypothetical protein
VKSTRILKFISRAEHVAWVPSFTLTASQGSLSPVGSSRKTPSPTSPFCPRPPGDFLRRTKTSPQFRQAVVQVVHPIVTTGRVRGARERASHISDSLAVPS